VLAGGRDPEVAWCRAWDGQWRLLMFDLPQGASQVRVKFWRWLRANHFGRLQGSVWVTPDPVADVAATAGRIGLEATMLTLFSGRIEGGGSGREVAVSAWDFAAIERDWSAYLGFARRTLRALRERPQAESRLLGYLHEERRLWWAALRADPLLPQQLLPETYPGREAAALRRELHRELAAAWKQAG
jgi:phenylacetic acid degradation operon negative regulatory protein